MPFSNFFILIVAEWLCNIKIGNVGNVYGCIPLIFITDVRRIFPPLEQIPRFSFWHFNIPNVWCCHHGSHLPQHDHNDGGNLWAKWNKDKHPQQNQYHLCYHLYCRMCAEIAGSEAVLFFKCLEHIWFSCCYYVTCW